MSTPDCPECVAGKHDNCDGTSWNPAADDIDACPCAKRGHKPEQALHPDHVRLMGVEARLLELLGEYESSGILSASRVRQAMTG